MRDMNGGEPGHGSHRDEHVWQIIDELHDSETVSQTRRYMAQRERLKAARRSLTEWMWPRGVVAGLISTGILAFFATYSLQQPFKPETFATAIGQTKRVQLADGSEATLDTDSAMAVSFDGDERRVKLLKGRANFAVAHDFKRPFKVSSAEMVITAVGTEFVVSVASNKQMVTLLKGSVAVDTLSGGNGRPIEHRMLQPGQKFMLRPDGASEFQKFADIPAETAWRDNRMEFSGTPASEAIAEANRYSLQKIRLADARASSQRVGGSFRTGQQEVFAEALCALLRVRIIHRSEREIVIG